jgi:hypothetical protein
MRQPSSVSDPLSSSSLPPLLLTTSQFHSRLKTFLFSKSYPP